MNTNGMQPFLWRLLFIVLIYVPGLTLNAIKDSSPTSSAASADAPTTTTISPSLLKNSVSGRTFQRTPPNTKMAASLIRDDFISSTATSIVTRSTTIDATSEKKATNFSQHSLTTTLATVAAASTVAATMAQVTKATLWNSEAMNEEAEVDNSAYKTLSNDGYGNIIDYNNNAYNKSNNSSNIVIGASINENIRIVSESSNSNSNINNKVTSYNSRNQQQQQQRLLQKSKTQQLQHESKSQEVDLATSKQYVRQVQQELSTTSTATTTITTTAATIRITEEKAIYENNNLLDAAADDKNVRENEEEYELPTKEKLKMANPEMTTIKAIAIANATATTDAVTTLYETTSLTASSIPEATPTSATPTAMATTSTAETTTTTTAKPKLPLAVDGYQTITSQAGTHAYLPCNVKQLVKKPISWLRVRDGHILTVDQTTFIADQRFQSIYTPSPERWSLQIKYVQTKDAGTYECQVSTEPKTSAIVTLQIVEPKTELIGESTRHVKAGSQVKLRCIISQALEPPLFINWFYNQKQIYLHNRRGWRTEIERIELPPEMPSTTTTTMTSMATTTSTQSIAATMIMGIGKGFAVSTSKPTSSHTSMSLSADEDRETAILSAALRAFPTTTAATSTMTTAAADVKQITTASLIIPSVEKQDSGNYTCSPSNSAPITVVLHVLNDMATCETRVTADSKIDTQAGEYSASAITSGISSNFILIGQRGVNQQQQHCYWNNTPTILALLWIIRFLHSMEFGSETTTTAEASNNMNNTSNNKGNKCASSQRALATTAAAIRPISTIKLTETTTTIPWVLTEEKT